MFAGVFFLFGARSEDCAVGPEIFESLAFAHGIPTKFTFTRGY